MSEEETTIKGDMNLGTQPLPVMSGCNICGKEFKGQAGLKIHMKSHDPKNKLRGHKKKAAPIKTKPPDYPHNMLKTEEQISKPNEPWRPASLLTNTKIPGMRPRWVRKDLLEKRIEEGWQPRLSDSKGRLEAPEKTLVDGLPLSRYVTKRNLVLCDMPESMALSRADYYKNINDQGLKGQKARLSSETGGQSYGDITVER